MQKKRKREQHTQYANLFEIFIRILNCLLWHFDGCLELAVFSPCDTFYITGTANGFNRVREKAHILKLKIASYVLQ